MLYSLIMHTTSVTTLFVGSMMSKVTMELPVLPWGPFIYYVITFLGFLDPLPPYLSMFFNVTLVVEMKERIHKS